MINLDGCFPSERIQASSHHHHHPTAAPLHHHHNHYSAHHSDAIYEPHSRLNSLLKGNGGGGGGVGNHHTEISLSQPHPAATAAAAAAAAAVHHTHRPLHHNHSHQTGVNHNVSHYSQYHTQQQQHQSHHQSHHFQSMHSSNLSIALGQKKVNNLSQNNMHNHNGSNSNSCANNNNSSTKKQVVSKLQQSISSRLKQNNTPINSLLPPPYPCQEMVVNGNHNGLSQQKQSKQPTNMTTNMVSQPPVVATKSSHMKISSQNQQQQTAIPPPPPPPPVVHEPIDGSALKKKKKSHLSRDELSRVCQGGEVTFESYNGSGYMIAIRSMGDRKSLIGYRCDWNNCGYMNARVERMFGHIRSQHPEAPTVRKIVTTTGPSTTTNTVTTATCAGKNSCSPTTTASGSSSTSARLSLRSSSSLSSESSSSSSSLSPHESQQKAANIKCNNKTKNNDNNNNLSSPHSSSLASPNPPSNLNSCSTSSLLSALNGNHPLMSPVTTTNGTNSPANIVERVATPLENAATTNNPTNDSSRNMTLDSSMLITECSPLRAASVSVCNTGGTKDKLLDLLSQPSTTKISNNSNQLDANLNSHHNNNRQQESLMSNEIDNGASHKSPQKSIIGNNNYDSNVLLEQQDKLNNIEIESTKQSILQNVSAMDGSMSVDQSMSNRAVHTPDQFAQTSPGSSGQQQSPYVLIPTPNSVSSNNVDRNNNHHLISPGSVGSSVHQDVTPSGEQTTTIAIKNEPEGNNTEIQTTTTICASVESMLDAASAVNVDNNNDKIDDLDIFGEDIESLFNDDTVIKPEATSTPFSSETFIDSIDNKFSEFDNKPQQQEPLIGNKDQSSTSLSNEYVNRTIEPQLQEETNKMELIGSQNQTNQFSSYSTFESNNNNNNNNNGGNLNENSLSFGCDLTQPDVDESLLMDESFEMTDDGSNGSTGSNSSCGKRKKSGSSKNYIGKQNLFQEFQNEEVTKIRDSENKYIIALQKNMKIVGYRCDWPACEFLTCRKYVMVNHINGKHTNQRPYTCPMCSFNFVKRYFLKAHLLKVHKQRIVLDKKDEEEEEEMLKDLELKREYEELYSGIVTPSPPPPLSQMMAQSQSTTTSQPKSNGTKKLKVNCNGNIPRQSQAQQQQASGYYPSNNHQSPYEHSFNGQCGGNMAINEFGVNGAAPTDLAQFPNTNGDFLPMTNGTTARYPGSVNGNGGNQCFYTDTDGSYGSEMTGVNAYKPTNGPSTQIDGGSSVFMSPSPSSSMASAMPPFGATGSTTPKGNNCGFGGSVYSSDSNSGNSFECGQQNMTYSGNGAVAYGNQQNNGLQRTYSQSSQTSQMGFTEKPINNSGGQLLTQVDLLTPPLSNGSNGNIPPFRGSVNGGGLLTTTNELYATQSDTFGNSFGAENSIGGHQSTFNGNRNVFEDFLSPPSSISSNGSNFGMGSSSYSIDQQQVNTGLSANNSNKRVGNCQSAASNSMASTSSFYLHTPSPSPSSLSHSPASGATFGPTNGNTNNNANYAVTTSQTQFQNNFVNGFGGDESTTSINPMSNGGYTKSTTNVVNFNQQIAQTSNIRAQTQPPQHVMYGNTQSSMSAYNSYDNSGNCYANFDQTDVNQNFGSMTNSSARVQQQQQQPVKAATFYPHTYNNGNVNTNTSAPMVSNNGIGMFDNSGFSSSQGPPAAANYGMNGTVMNGNGGCGPVMTNGTSSKIMMNNMYGGNDTMNISTFHSNAECWNSSW